MARAGRSGAWWAWALAGLLAGVAPPARAGEVPLTAEMCLSCHANPLTGTLASGEVLSLQVKPQELDRSVHGGKLGCTDCHRDIRQMPHPRRAFATRRRS